MRLRKQLIASTRPLVMAVMNVTPDSFYTESRVDSQSEASVVDRAAELIKQGADILDIGGESTRPGASPVGIQEEMDRVLPAVAAIRERFDTTVSVDTSSPELMHELNTHDIDLINDVRALSKPGAIQAAAECDVPVCLMHMQEAPDTMQNRPRYKNVVKDIISFLERRKATCMEAGIAPENILIDPGFGFGKTDMHNLEILNQLSEFSSIGTVLVGLSRKSMIGRLLGRKANERLPASLALAAAAFERGARVIRVHDVKQTRDVLDMLWILHEQASTGAVPEFPI